MCRCSLLMRLKAKPCSPWTVKQRSLPEGRTMLKCGSSPPPICTANRDDCVKLSDNWREQEREVCV